MILKNWKNLQLNKTINLVFTTCFIVLITSHSQAKISNKQYRANEVPKDLQGIQITEKLGQSIDLNNFFINENNKKVSLKNYFTSAPVIMSIIYYNCPSLCNFHLNALFKTLNQLSGSIPAYQLVLVSMDARETPALAKEKKTNYLKTFNKLQKKDIHFLTGSNQAIKNLANQIGFAFRWDKETSQFAHTPVAYALTSAGLISRYLYGIEFQEKTLKLAILEAGEGKIGNIIDRILLFCYRFNPKEKKYSIYAFRIMQIAGALMIFVLLLLFIPVWLKERS